MAEKHRSTITAYETLAPDFASIKTPYALSFRNYMYMLFESSFKNSPADIPISCLQNLERYLEKNWLK